MYDPSSLMFQSLSLETRFASMVRCDTEIGGYLFVSFDFPGLHWKTMRKHAAGLGRLRIVHDWLIVPNLHKEPAGHYLPFSWQAGRQIADATCLSRHGWRSYAVPFHSHPPGFINGLSVNDATVALAYERIHEHTPFAETVVASSYPFRMIAYTVRSDIKKPASPIAKRGEFYSWREKRFADLRLLMEAHP